jgi:type IV secretory pathway protease TraF
VTRKLLVIAGALAFSGFAFFAEPPELFILNFSPSLPRGLYLLSRRPPEVGDYAVVSPEALAYNEGVGTRLIKKIAFSSGEEISLGRDSLIVDGVRVFPKYRDAGVEFHGRLAHGRCILLGDHPRSFDSRYFGPVGISDCSRAVPLLVWKGPL